MQSFFPWSNSLSHDKPCARTTSTFSHAFANAKPNSARVFCYYHHCAAPPPVTLVLRVFTMSLIKLGAKLSQRLFSALSSSLVYLNLSRNALEGELPLAALIPQSCEVASERSDAESDVDGGTRAWAAEIMSSPLTYLNISHNQLTGSIPDDVGALTSLDTLDLSRNKLEGPVPRGIGGCGALRNLSLSRCGLSGKLDQLEDKTGRMGGGLEKLAQLESLRLDGNAFEGIVPATLGNLTRLEVLQLQVDENETATEEEVQTQRQLVPFAAFTVVAKQ